MSTFDYRRNRRQQLVAKGEPVDNNISFDGKTKDFLNMFANKMKDTNNLYQSQRFPEFDDQTSDIVRQNLISQSDGYGQFNDMEKQIKSDAFVNKFREKSGYRFSYEHSIYVNPDYINNGYGNKILNELVKICKKISKIKNLIEVIFGNTWTNMINVDKQIFGIHFQNYITIIIFVKHIHTQDNYET